MPTPRGRAVGKPTSAIKKRDHQFPYRLSAILRRGKSLLSLVTLSLPVTRDLPTIVTGLSVVRSGAQCKKNFNFLLNFDVATRHITILAYDPSVTYCAPNP